LVHVMTFRCKVSKEIQRIRSDPKLVKLHGWHVGSSLMLPYISSQATAAFMFSPSVTLLHLLFYQRWLDLKKTNFLSIRTKSSLSVLMNFLLIKFNIWNKYITKQSHHSNLATLGFPIISSVLKTFL